MFARLVGHRLALDVPSVSLSGTLLNRRTVTQFKAHKTVQVTPLPERYKRSEKERLYLETSKLRLYQLFGVIF